MARRILHVVTSVVRGGAETQLAHLARGQLAQGATVGVAYLKGPPYWAPALRAAGVTVTDLGLRWYGDPAPVTRLRRLIRAMRPDVVHAHLPPGELYARLALLGSRWRGSLAITKHAPEPFVPGPGARPLGMWVARRAGLVIAISDAVARYVRATLGVPAGRLRTVHYGLDPGPYRAVTREQALTFRRSFDVGDDELLIGTVCRLVPAKAIPVLLGAFARRPGPRNARLMIIGAGPLERALRAEAHRLGLGRGVIWTGFRDDIPVAMKAFDVFALSSDYEGFGLVLLEAMAGGTPIVATRVSAVPEVVTDGETGLLVPPGDPAALAGALARMDDAEIRKRLGAAGQAAVGARFTVPAMVAATEAAYRDLLDGGTTAVGDGE